MAARTVILPGAEPQVLNYDDGALSTRARVLAWLIATVLLIGGAGVLAAAGLTPLTGARTTTTTSTTAADTTSGTTTGSTDTTGNAATGTTTGTATDSTVDGAIHAEWDGPTVHVDWTGEEYATVEAEFIGDRVAAPGDRVTRTLNIANDGPSDAVMTVELSVGQDLPAGTANADLAEAVDLFWDVAGVTGSERFAVLLDQDRPTIAEVAVPSGQTARVTLGFELPADVVDHTNAGADSTALQFQVQARMQGETTGVVPSTPDLAITGAQVAGVALLVLGLLVVGWLLVLIARRRTRCDDCGRPIRRGEDCTVHHIDGRRQVLCADCRLLDR